MNAVLYNSGISSDTTITDTVEVSIINANPPYLIRQKVKSILYTDGKFNCKLNPFLSGGSYYISLSHRNVFETWSAHPIYFNKNTYYDFSIAEWNWIIENKIIDESEGNYSFKNGWFLNTRNNSA